ncbi:MAG TPA: hypothetical protein VMG98_10270 [Verrucomicrobiae bacterium]|nr:hypothetical protein [Verrucomicrobiae bacterium]
MSSFLTGLLESIGLRKRQRPRVGLRPHRTVSVPLGVDAAYERVLDAFARVLGANIYVDDRSTHMIEAGFGLVNAERLRVSLESQGATQTTVHIEAFYPAGTERPPNSRSVDALADALSQ